MKTNVEREGPTKLRLVIEVEPDELEPLYDQTMKRLAQEVTVPGFRKGKAPRSLIETRVGEDTLRQEVLRDAVPNLYERAASAESVRAVSFPEIEVTQFAKGKPLHFTATIEVRPQLKLPEYKGIEVSRPSVTVTGEEVDEQLQRLRERFGTLEPVARNAIQSDNVTIDLRAYRHEEQIEAASAQDLLYEVGSNTIVSELDKELEGKRTGDILKFNATLPERFGPPYGGQEVSFSVIVKEVQAKRLLPLDDDFAKTASEFDTLEELSTEIRDRLESVRKVQAESEVRTRVLEDLIDRSDVPLPEAMVDREVERLIGRLARDLERMGTNVGEYLAATNTAGPDLVASQREVAEKNVAALLILEALGEAEGLEVSEEEIATEIEQLAAMVNRPPEKLRAELDESGAVETLAGDILRRKALDYLVEHAKVTDETA